MSAKKVGLSKTKELSIYTRIRKGDNAAIHELVQAHLDYAVTVATRLAAGSFPPDEIRSAAVAGLYDAIRTWNARKGRFTTHSSYAVRRKVFELWSGQIGVKISCKSYNRLKRDGGAITRVPIELAESGSRRGDVNTGDEAYCAFTYSAASPPDSRELERDKKEALVEDEQARKQAERLDLHEKLATALEKLRPRERQVIVGKYFEDKTLVDIGKEWKPEPVSGEWMRVVHDMALNRLRRLMKP